MKPIQKFYESYDYTNLSLIQMKTLNHLRNLSEIHKKKPNISLYKPIKAKPMKFHNFSIFEEKKQQDDNKILQSKLMKISNKQPKPIINLDFIQYEENKVKGNILIKKLNKEKILKENNGLYKRLTKLKPFFNAKENDRNFNIEHSQNLKRIKKIKLGKLRTDIRYFKKLLIKNTSETSVILPTLKKNNSLKTIKKTQSCINLKNYNINNNLNSNSNNIINKTNETNEIKDNSTNNKNDNEFFTTAIKNI